MRKYIAEAIGTAVLVTIGCGTAMLVGVNADQGCGYLLTALAFGFAVVAMAYSVGNVSGCHINPAVSLGVLMSGGMTFVEFINYVIAQCVGAIMGSGVLALIFTLGKVEDKTGALGSNGLASLSGSALAGILVEAVLTFIFVMAVLGVTGARGRHGSFAGTVIGLSLILVHILGIGLTGTSVNPARSLGPAVISAIMGNTAPIKCTWVFVVGPFVGAAVAAGVYRFLAGEDRAAKPE